MQRKLQHAARDVVREARPGPEANGEIEADGRIVGEPGRAPGGRSLPFVEVEVVRPSPGDLVNAELLQRLPFTAQGDRAIPGRERGVEPHLVTLPLVPHQLCRNRARLVHADHVLRFAVLQRTQPAPA